jgi:DNA polymerase-3 subunit delta'
LSPLDIQVLQDQKALGILTALLRKERIPHALLLTGVEGIGKRTAALLFAMACNCRRIADGGAAVSAGAGIEAVAGCSCRSCRKILSGSHPDIHRVAPSGRMIKIERVRELCHTLSMKPYEAGLRVVIMEEAQAMNPESSNALLKMLEEPPDRTVFILTAPTPDDLLPTIASRCQTIRFHPLPQARVAAMLQERYGISPEDADALAILATGSPGRIDTGRSAERQAWFRRRRWILGRLAEMLTRSGRDLPVSSLLAVAERLSRKKAAVDGMLDIIKTWLRDLVVCRHCPDQVYHQEALNEIQRISFTFTEKSLLSKIEAVDAAQRDLRSNANIRLTLEVMVLQLAKK